VGGLQIVVALYHINRDMSTIMPYSIRRNGGREIKNARAETKEASVDENRFNFVLYLSRSFHVVSWS
jgi:hypothetical protein